MDPLDEIREAMRKIRDSDFFSVPMGEFVFEPIRKNRYVIRHLYESEEVFSRYKEYLDKYGATITPKKYQTKSGVRVRSKAELALANALTDMGYRYYYEPLLDFGKFFRKPDFYLPDYDVFIEHLGMNDSEYLLKVEKKKELYSRYGIRCAFTDANDEEAFASAIKEKLNRL
jgi:hypothetical protein